MTSVIGVKKKNLAFTLIEVMVTVAILSLATVMISQSNLMNMKVYGRFANRMAIQNWAEEKIWEAEEEILASEAPEAGDSSGTYESENKTYQWHLSISEEVSQSLYSIFLTITWNDAGQEISIERFSYAHRSKEAK